MPQELNLRELSEQVVSETEKIIFGKTRQIELIFMAVLSQGHILLDDLPGVGKTTLVKTLSKVLGCQTKRKMCIRDSSTHSRRLSFLVIQFYFGEGIGFRRNFELCIFNMCIDLCRI